jgi:hypothetical protein
MTEDFNPNEVVTRALLLMKYDSNKTLTENQDIVNKPIITESGAEDFATGAGVMGAGALGGAAAGGAVSALAGGTAAGAGALNAITSLSAFGPALANPVGIGVVALTGAFLYAAFRNADNEGVLRKTMEACSTVDKYQKEDELMQEAALDKEAHLQIAQLFYQGVYHRTLGFLAGTDEEKIDKAVKMMKNANVADLCGIIYEYQGEDFADDLAEDLSESELAPVVTAFRRAVSKYSGGGIKVIPDNSFSRKYYQERFPCLYQSKGTVASKVKIDPEGYTYVVINGKRRKKTDGTIYQKQYRFYAEGQRITTTSSNNLPKDTNATLACVSGRPVAQIGGGQSSEVEMNESLYEAYIRRNKIHEVFDDTGVKIIDDNDVDEDSEGWEDGKKVAAWPVWLKKYPCLRTKFPSSNALTDNMGYTYFINLNGLNKKNYRFYSDGEIWDAEGAKFIGKKWSCSLRGDTVLVESRRNMMEQIDFPIAGETDIKPSTSTSTTTIIKNLPECGSFPIKKGCKGDKIGEIQSALGIKIDRIFGPETEKALKQNGSTDGSLTQELYDKIMADFKVKQGGNNSGGNNNLPNDDKKVQDELITNNDPSVG